MLRVSLERMSQLRVRLMESINKVWPKRTSPRSRNNGDHLWIWVKTLQNPSVHWKIAAIQGSSSLQYGVVWTCFPSAMDSHHCPPWALKRQKLLSIVIDELTISMWEHNDFVQYPLVNYHITMENHHFSGRTHYFDWAIFNSYVSLPEGKPNAILSNNVPRGFQRWSHQ